MKVKNVGLFVFLIWLCCWKRSAYIQSQCIGWVLDWEAGCCSQLDQTPWLFYFITAVLDSIITGITALKISLWDSLCLLMILLKSSFCKADVNFYFCPVTLRMEYSKTAVCYILCLTHHKFHSFLEICCSFKQV